jgi:hypothetical protein
LGEEESVTLGEGEGELDTVRLVASVGANFGSGSSPEQPPSTSGSTTTPRANAVRERLTLCSFPRSRHPKRRRHDQR